MSKFQITVESSAPATKSWVRNIRKQQLPFATAVALTKSARHVVRETGEAIGDHFTLRAKGLRRVFTYQRAEKKDWPKTRAIVHLREWGEFMADHVEGADRRPEKGARRMAVPTSIVRRTKSGRIRKSQKPRRIRDRKGGTVSRVNGTTVIQIKRGPRAKRRAGIFFTLHKKVRIRKTWPVQNDASKSFRRHYLREFIPALDAAVRSARAQPGKFSTAEGRAFWNKAVAKSKT